MSKKIIIIGAGPGGLTSGMLLAHRGFQVDIYEKDSKVGGRNSSIEAQGYKFDVGPTFLMMKFLLDEIFQETRRDINDYLEFQELTPMYKLHFKDFEMYPTTDRKDMKRQIKKHFPGEEKGFDKFMEKESVRFKRFFPCLQKDYSSLREYLKPVFIKAIPYIATTKSMMQILDNYFKSDELKICFTFQSKYLGMSPWTCPGQFIIIPYIEYEFGVYHVKGGLSEISEAMSKVVKEEKGRIHLNTPIKRVLMRGKKAIGIELEKGEKKYADKVIINADFAYAMTNLVPKGKLKKWSPQKLKGKEYSCSTFMLYLGLDKLYDEEHHAIYFSDDYKNNLREIGEKKVLSKDPSFYVRNASINDDTLAPKGHSALYVLVPVPNNQSNIDWKKEKESFRELILQKIEEKTGMKDIRKHIKYEKILTPWDWEKNNVYHGATFNLAHTISQMLYWRPRNKFEEMENTYLVGGGTHPGSGLPTIYESGRITANMISRHYKIKFFTKNLEV